MSASREIQEAQDATVVHQRLARILGEQGKEILRLSGAQHFQSGLKAIFNLQPC